MKHLITLLTVLLLTACGAPTEDSFSTPTPNNYPPIVDNPLSRQESANSRIINNLDEESSPSLDAISHFEQEQRESVRSRTDRETYVCSRTGDFTTGWIRTSCTPLN